MDLPKFFFHDFIIFLFLLHKEGGLAHEVGLIIVELFTQNVENDDFSKNGSDQNPFSRNPIFSVLVPKNFPHRGLSIKHSLSNQ